MRYITEFQNPQWRQAALIYLIALDLTSLQMWHPLITESELVGCIQSLMNYLDKTGVPLPTRTYDSVTIIYNALTEGV